MSGFRYRGIHSSARHIALLESPVSILPPARERVVVIPGRPGAVRLAPTLGERHLTLRCLLERGATAADTRARVDALLAWLAPTSTGGWLELDSETDRGYRAMLAPDSIDAASIIDHRVFEVAFVCADPYGYAVTPQSVARTAGELPHTHVQTGNAIALPWINIHGRCAPGQSIALTIGGVTMTYRGVLNDGVLNDAEVLAIDCQEQTALRHATGGPFNVLRDFDRPQFYSLAPGNNTISAAVTGGATIMSVYIDCRNRWL